MQLIIDTANTSLAVRNKCFYIVNEEQQRQISPSRISSIAITVNCTVNAAAIKLAAHQQIPIIFYNNFGTVQARMYSPYFSNLASLRKKQYLFSQSSIASHWLIGLLQTKSEEQILNLRRYYKYKGRTTAEVDSLEAQIRNVLNSMTQSIDQPINVIRGSLLGWEGTISRLYFSGLQKLMPPLFSFSTRSRKPALDYFNAALNYLYGMTYGVVESGLFAKGLDPGVGILHVDAYQNPTLAYDLIEPIRPLIDRILLDLIWTEQLSENHFIKKEQGFWMNKSGKRIVIQSFADFLQQRMQYKGSVRRLKDHIFEESNQLGNLIEETIILK